MIENHSLETLKDIKRMMERSSRFISLSGISGISAGIFALIGAIIAWPYVYGFKNLFIIPRMSSHNYGSEDFLGVFQHMDLLAVKPIQLIRSQKPERKCLSLILRHSKRSLRQQNIFFFFNFVVQSAF